MRHFNQFCNTARLPQDAYLFHKHVNDLDCNTAGLQHCCKPWGISACRPAQKLTCQSEQQAAAEWQMPMYAMMTGSISLYIGHLASVTMIAYEPLVSLEDWRKWTYRERRYQATSVRTEMKSMSQLNSTIHSLIWLRYRRMPPAAAALPDGPAAPLEDPPAAVSSLPSAQPKVLPFWGYLTMPLLLLLVTVKSCPSLSLFNRTVQCDTFDFVCQSSSKEHGTIKQAALSGRRLPLHQTNFAHKKGWHACVEGLPACPLSIIVKYISRGVQIHIRIYSTPHGQQL